MVMICRMWDVHAATSRYLSIDFIETDTKGNVMHCTVKANIAHNFLRLKEGSIYSVKNLTVVPNKDEFCVIRLADFMLEFDGKTTVRKSFLQADGFTRYPFQLVEIDELEPTNNKYLIGFVGYVTNVGRITQTRTGSKTLDFYMANCSTSSTLIVDDTKIPFLMRLNSDDRGQQIRVTLWGGLGDMLIKKRTRHVGLPVNQPVNVGSPLVDHLTIAVDDDQALEEKATVMRPIFKKKKNEGSRWMSARGNVPPLLTSAPKGIGNIPGCWPVILGILLVVSTLLLLMAVVENVLSNESRVMSQDHFKQKNDLESLKSKKSLLEHEMSKLDDQLGVQEKYFQRVGWFATLLEGGGTSGGEKAGQSLEELAAVEAPSDTADEDPLTWLPTRCEDKKGWNYPSCGRDKCKKGNLDRKDGRFWCDSCNSSVDYPVIRYRLELDISDETAEAMVVMFDETARVLLNCYASSILE
nr:hypothetical protein [Tanacetum cinerariifolium]